MAGEHFAAAATWRRLLDEYYSKLVGDDPALEPKRPVRPEDPDIEIEPLDPGSFTQGNPLPGPSDPAEPNTDEPEGHHD